MSVFKKVEDIVEVAVRLERKGTDFYNQLHDKVESPALKDVFSFLAAEEEKHAGTFRTILDRIADYQPRYKYPGEYELFLSGIASSILEKAGKAARALSSGKADLALDAGIELEKESILFYSELLKEFKAKDQKIIQRIINEERLHWKKLSSLKKKVKF